MYSGGSDAAGLLALPVLCWFAFQCAALFRATVLALRERPIPASFAPLAVYIYGFGGESCTTRHPLLRSARLRLGTRASPSAIPSLRSALTSFGGYPTMTAQCTLGSWGKATHARRAFRGKARLLPRAASTIRVTMLRRRDTASSPRSRLVSHHANQSLAVPLRSLLARVALTRPSAMARFSS